MFSGVNAAIFDMDGTIIDSMWIWSSIDESFLSKRNIQMPKDFRHEIEHLSFIDTALYFKNRFHLKDSLEEIIDEWNTLAYEQYSTKVNLKSGVVNFLSYLKSKNIKIGMATSNNMLLVETALKRNNIFQFFDSITIVDEVERDKNYPDIYLLAAKKLDVCPSSCIVFEDILPAVKGAKAAGMKVIGVYDLYSECQKNAIINEADKYIIDFNELIQAV